LLDHLNKNQHWRDWSRFYTFKQAVLNRIEKRKRQDYGGDDIALDSIKFCPLWSSQRDIDKLIKYLLERKIVKTARVGYDTHGNPNCCIHHLSLTW